MTKTAVESRINFPSEGQVDLEVTTKKTAFKINFRALLRHEQVVLAYLFKSNTPCKPSQIYQKIVHEEISRMSDENFREAFKDLKAKNYLGFIIVQHKSNNYSSQLSYDSKIPQEYILVREHTPNSEHSYVNMYELFKNYSLEEIIKRIKSVGSHVIAYTTLHKMLNDFTSINWIGVRRTGKSKYFYITDVCAEQIKSQIEDILPPTEPDLDEFRIQYQKMLALKIL